MIEGSGVRTSLGRSLEVFKPSLANIVAGYVLSLIFVAGGIVAIAFILHELYLAGGHLPFSTARGMCWVAVILGSGLSILVIVGGACFAGYTGALSWLQVEFYAEGFRFLDGATADKVHWSEVVSIVEIVLYQRPPLLKWPAILLLPKLKSRGYSVKTRGGKEYGFDGDSVGRIGRLGALLREQSARYGVPWETVEKHD